MPELPDLPVIAANDVPLFVGQDEHAQFRWRVCVGVAQQMDDRAWWMIAGALYGSDIPTDKAAEQQSLFGSEPG